LQEGKTFLMGVRPETPLLQVVQVEAHQCRILEKLACDARVLATSPRHRDGRISNVSAWEVIEQENASLAEARMIPVDGERAVLPPPF
jgi:hypothetical protein